MDSAYDFVNISDSISVHYFRILPLQEQASDIDTKSTKVAHDAPEEFNALQDDQETEQTFKGVGIRNRLKSTLLKRLRLPDRNRFASEKLISSRLAPGSKEKEDSPLKRLNLKTKNNPPSAIRKVQPKASGKRTLLICTMINMDIFFLAK